MYGTGDYSLVEIASGVAEYRGLYIHSYTYIDVVFDCVNTGTADHSLGSNRNETK